MLSRQGLRTQPADADRVLDPLWRGLVGYRLLALCYAAGLVATSYPDYRRPGWAVAVLGVLAGWTALTTVGYCRPGWPRARLALADLAITIGAVLSTLAVDDPTRIQRGEPVLSTVWSAGPAIALALRLGPVPGLAGALSVQAAVVVVRGHLGTEELTDLLLMVASAAAVGYAATVLRAAVERLRASAELRAALAERERLARSVHDGVLQVLARVRRQGAELGGPAAELGELAGEQEVVLRTLVSTELPVRRPAGQRDLATALGELATTRVSVALPPDAVPLAGHTVGEVVAAVRAVLDNVDAHAGPEARAWLLLEQTDGAVVLSVRDDGPGIPAGRLAEAAACGRLGVRESIVRRIESLGGTAHCASEPGLGCEWTFVLPGTPS